MSNIEIEELELEAVTYVYCFTITQHGNTYHGKLIHKVNESGNLPVTIYKNLIWDKCPYALDYHRNELIDQLFEFMSEE